MFSGTFWRAAFERAVKTFAQTAAATIVVDQATPAAISWQQVGIAAAVAALLSLLLSVASSPIGPAGSPSLVVDDSAAPAPLPSRADRDATADEREGARRPYSSLDPGSPDGPGVSWRS